MLAYHEHGTGDPVVLVHDPAGPADAVIVALLRRAGIPVTDIGRFLADPSGDAVDGWERSLAAEVHARRQALAEARGRMGPGRWRDWGTRVRHSTASPSSSSSWTNLVSIYAMRYETRSAGATSAS